MFAIFMNKKMLPVIPVKKILYLHVSTLKKDRFISMITIKAVINVNKIFAKINVIMLAEVMLKL